MLYAIIGESKKGREKLKELLGVLAKKQPDALEVRFEVGDRSIEALKAGLDEMLASQGLFSSKYIVVLDELLTDEESREVVQKSAKEIIASEHAFILIETKVDAASKKALIAKAQKVFSVEDKSASGGEKKVFQDSFALAEAFGRRDKVSAWRLYIQEKESGMEIEKIHGGMLWQMKSIVLAGKTKSASEVGMKDYPYSKAKSFLRNYSLDEAEDMLAKLVSIYHDAHRGGLELDLALEKLILEM